MKHTKGNWNAREYIGVTKESKLWNFQPVYFKLVCDKKAPGGIIIAKCMFVLLN